MRVPVSWFILLLSFSGKNAAGFPHMMRAAGLADDERTGKSFVLLRALGVGQGREQKRNRSLAQTIRIHMRGRERRRQKSRNRHVVETGDSNGARAVDSHVLQRTDQ